MHKPIVEENINGGTQKIYKFDNGYGASVVKHSFSYGLELAVIKFSDNDTWKLWYETPITDDVIGHNTEESITRLLNEIEALPKA